MPISKTSQNSFSQLNIQDLVDTFSLTKTSELKFPLIEISPSEGKIQELIDKAKDEINYWTEQELVVKHISLILDLADLRGENYNTFAERIISGNVQGYELGGYVDFLVAKGKYEPREPYFFIHEYKKTTNATGDPLAQLLGEMLVAQKLNNEETMHGLYIIGKTWNFVVLKNSSFCEESLLDSTNFEDLQTIFYKLAWIKQYIEEKLKN